MFDLCIVSQLYVHGHHQTMIKMPDCEMIGHRNGY